MIESYQGQQEDFWRWALDHDVSLTEYEYRLRGYFLNDQGQWERMMVNGQPTKTIVNDVGARELVNELKQSLDKSFSITDLEEEDIHELAFNFAITIIKKLALNYKLYGISKADLISGCLVRQLHDRYYAILRQSTKGTLVSKIAENHQHHEVKNINEDLTPKKGLFGLSLGR